MSGDALRERGDRTVMEAVTQATGITGVAGPGNGNSGLSARGFTGVTSVMQLYDGTQLYVGSGTVTFPYDIWTVDRIEVLSGPASVLYGQGAIGGVVNVVPRRPNPTNFENSVRLAIGSDNTFREAVDSTGPLSSKASYRLDVSHNSSDGWVDRGQSDSLAISGSLRVDMTPDLHFVLSNDYGNQNPMGYFGVPLINGQLNTALRYKNFNASNATINWVDNWTQLKTEWAATDYITIHNDVYWLSTNRHWREIEAYPYQKASATILEGTFLEVYHNESQYGDHADATFRSEIFGMKNEFEAGFDLNRVRFENSSNTPFAGSATLNPFNFTPINFTPTTTAPRLLTHTDQYAPFTEDRLSLTDQVSLVAGLRYDHYDFSRTDMAAHTTTSRGFSSSSWRTGIVYNPVPNIALYGQFANATDPVSSLISLSVAQEQFTLARGKEFEAGVKGSLWDNRAEWTFAAYEIIKKNLLIADPINPAITDQIGQQSSHGLEASFAFDVGYGWRVQANGTILRAKFDRFASSVGGVAVSYAGNTPPNVPSRAANLFATWNFLPGWEASSGLQYVGHRYADNANTLILPSYYVFNLGLRWFPTERIETAVNLYNALDSVYAAAPSNGGTQWVLGPPRAIEASVTVKF